MNAEPISAYTGRINFHLYKNDNKKAEYWFAVNPGCSSIDTLERASCFLDEIKTHIQHYGMQFSGDSFPEMSLVLLVDAVQAMINAVIIGSEKKATGEEEANHV